MKQEINRNISTVVESPHDTFNINSVLDKITGSNNFNRIISITPIPMWEGSKIAYVIDYETKV